MSDAFTRLALKGEPYDLGYQHGRRLAAAIADNCGGLLHLVQALRGPRSRGGVWS